MTTIGRRRRGRRLPRSAVAAGPGTPSPRPGYWPPSLLGLIPLVWILVYVLVKGFKAITTAAWWTDLSQGILPSRSAGESTTLFTAP